MQLIKVEPNGLDTNKAKEISDLFKPMLDKMVELEGEFNQLICQEPSKAVCKQAGALRWKYVKVRTGTADIHKKLKAHSLNFGRFVDGWKNAQIMASQENEFQLEQLEKHYERIEAELIIKIKRERIAELKKFKVDGSNMKLGTMANEVWLNYLSAVEEQFKIDEAAAKVKAEEMMAKRKAEKKRQEAQRKENIRLKKEASIKDKALKKKNKELADIQKALQDQKDKEAKELHAKYEAAEKLKQASDKDLLEAMKDSIEHLPCYNMTSEKGKNIQGKTIDMLNKAFYYLDMEIISF